MDIFFLICKNKVPCSLEAFPGFFLSGSTEPQQLCSLAVWRGMPLWNGALRWCKIKVFYSLHVQTAPSVAAHPQKDSCSLSVLINHKEALQQCLLPHNGNRCEQGPGGVRKLFQLWQKKCIIERLDVLLNCSDANPINCYFGEGGANLNSLSCCWKPKIHSLLGFCFFNPRLPAKTLQQQHIYNSPRIPCDLVFWHAG